MKRGLAWLALVGLLAAGCGESPKMAGSGSSTGGATKAPSAEPAPESNGEEVPEAAGSSEAPDNDAAAAIAEGTIQELTPENTRIVFIGTHTGEKPDPRIGGFEQFIGKVGYDPTAKALQSVLVTIETDSIWTKIPQLTAHLSNADFFDVKEFPAAQFKSTKVKVTDAATGEHTITGDLTLHGVTKPVTFPATVTIDDSGLALKSEFKIDRTQWEMSFGQGKVDNDITLILAIGEKTDPAATELPPQ